jgi:hypothetical protein
MDARKSTKKTSMKHKVRTRPVYHDSVSTPSSTRIHRESIGRPIVSSHKDAEKSEFLKTSSVIILVVTVAMFILAVSYALRRKNTSYPIDGSCPSCPKATASLKTTPKKSQPTIPQPTKQNPVTTRIIPSDDIKPQLQQIIQRQSNSDWLDAADDVFLDKNIDPLTGMNIAKPQQIPRGTADRAHGIKNEIEVTSADQFKVIMSQYGDTKYAIAYVLKTCPACTRLRQMYSDITKYTNTYLIPIVYVDSSVISSIDKSLTTSSKGTPLAGFPTIKIMKDNKVLKTIDGVPRSKDDLVSEFSL